MKQLRLHAAELPDFEHHLLNTPQAVLLSSILDNLQNIFGDTGFVYDNLSDKIKETVLCVDPVSIQTGLTCASAC
jgi:hypothetical protein